MKNEPKVETFRLAHCYSVIDSELVPVCWRLVRNVPSEIPSFEHTFVLRHERHVVEGKLPTIQDAKAYFIKHHPLKTNWFRRSHS